MTLPVAPPLDECDPQEYVFVISTGTLCGPSGVMLGLPVAQLDATVRVDVTGLDHASFWDRGGPVCWYHDKAIGRTTWLGINRASGHLEAAARFGRCATAWNVRRTLEHIGRSGERGTLAASISVEHRIGDAIVDSQLRRIVIRHARLLEWSVVSRGADAGAVSLGRVVLKVRSE